MSDIAGRLWAASGICRNSPDGYTYLNDEARQLLADAAAEIQRLEKVSNQPASVPVQDFATFIASTGLNDKEQVRALHMAIVDSSQHIHFSSIQDWYASKAETIIPPFSAALHWLEIPITDAIKKTAADIKQCYVPIWLKK